MKNKKTYYMLILDKSGSMMSVANKTVEGFNEQVQMIKDLEKKFPEQKIRVSLTTFNHNVSHDIFLKKPKKLPLLKAALRVNGRSDVQDDNVVSYQPEGMTALYDAIGLSVKKLKKEIKKEIKKDKATAIVVILTDGHENSSRLYKYEKITYMIKKLEKTGNWTFSYLGATPDAVEIAGRLNINKHNAMALKKEDMAISFKILDKAFERRLMKKREGKKPEKFL